MSVVRLTAAQALVRFLTQQFTEIDGARVPLFAGVWAIFGHGNVAGLGEALFEARDSLPTWRAHNEQAMALAAVAFAKTSRRRRMMACTTSIGPGATNMVTAAAVAHVNRLPILLLPGDIFANRAPDPVLQQIEDFGDGTVSANDCFRPVSRYFDRITRPEQIMPALSRALAVLTDPAECGPVTLAFCQDVQAQAFDYPERFFTPRLHHWRRAPPDAGELASAVAALRGSKKPLIIAGGGVIYAQAERTLADFAARHGVPVAETQAGKSSMPQAHDLAMGAIGVTGTTAANECAVEADCILAIGTRLADFTSGSRALWGRGATLIGLNVQVFDASKHDACPLVADASAGLDALAGALDGWHAAPEWTAAARDGAKRWLQRAADVTGPTDAAFPSDAEVIGAVQRAAGADAIVLGAAGGLPGELHKLWQATQPLGYHLEYGYSTMGYEIAGGLGAKMAAPDREVIVMVGDGSYLMMNSELATAAAMAIKLIVVVCDNRGFGCIDRLQRSTGSAGFNNLWADARYATQPRIDFVGHARSLGVDACKVGSAVELETALRHARAAAMTQVIVIETDPAQSTAAGGAWWDVAVPETSHRADVQEARVRYEVALGERDRN